MSTDSKERELAQTIIRVTKEKKPRTVAQLASLVKERLPIPEQEILEAILKLQGEGKIQLAKQPSPTPPKLTNYLKTEQAHWFWATIAITILTAVVVLTIPEDIYPWVYIRYVLGTVFIMAARLHIHQSIVSKKRN